jgi:hypothetical protein
MNRTRDLWICSQELWPLDHRGGLLGLHNNTTFIVGFDVLRPVTLQSTILWDVTPSRSVEVYRFWQTFLPHPEDLRVGQQGTLEETNDVNNVIFLIFDPEDGGSAFLHNVGGLLPNYTVLRFIGQLDL